MQRISFLIVIGVLFCGWGALPSGFQENQLIPEEIQVFYRDYNFVCSFTTRSERVQMAACLDDGVLPNELNSQRHQEVFSRMKRLIQKVLILDPKMVIPSGVENNLQKLIFRQELFEVKAFRRSRDSAGVDVFAYTLEPEMVMRYISEYEDNQGETDKIPSESQILQESRSRIEQRLETHTWKYMNRRWVKTFNSYLFLKK